MSPQQVLLISMVLYVTVPLRMIIRGWFLCAGLAMLLIAQLPIIWQVHFSDSETPGFALLAILLSTPRWRCLSAALAYWLFNACGKAAHGRAVKDSGLASIISPKLLLYGARFEFDARANGQKFLLLFSKRSAFFA